MARGPDAFFYGFTGIINHRFLTNQISRTISVILQKGIFSFKRVSYVQTNATTPNTGRPTTLGVVASVLAVACKRMQQLPTMFGPAVQRGKDPSRGPKKCWRSCANGSKIVALRFGDQGSKEVGDTG